MKKRNFEEDYNKDNKDIKKQKDDSLDDINCLPLIGRERSKSFFIDNENFSSAYSNCPELMLKIHEYMNKRATKFITSLPTIYEDEEMVDFEYYNNNDLTSQIFYGFDI